MQVDKGLSAWSGESRWFVDDGSTYYYIGDFSVYADDFIMYFDVFII